MRVLICGGGVIGASIAYFLSCRGVEAIVIERTGIACAASGKSGGFLALDWCDGSAAAGLGPAQLRPACEPAREDRGDWGYRRLTTYGGHAVPAAEDVPAAQHAVAWLSWTTWSSIAASARRRPPPRCIPARSPPP